MLGAREEGGYAAKRVPTFFGPSEPPEGSQAFSSVEVEGYCRWNELTNEVGSEWLLVIFTLHKGNDRTLEECDCSLL